MDIMTTRARRRARRCRPAVCVNVWAMPTKPKFVLKKQNLGNLNRADLETVGGGILPRMLDCSNDNPRNPLTPGNPDPFQG
jgi:hypothetical protein